MQSASCHTHLLVSLGIRGNNFPLNDEIGLTWWVASTNGIKKPYELLPTIFSDISQEGLDSADQEDGEDIREDDHHTTSAYSRM